jgi:hypothetical protein
MSVQRFMVDIETLGTKPNSIILSIGCASFNTNRIGPVAVHYTRVDVPSCEALGLKMDWDTVRWWMEQHEAARREILDTEGTATIYNALQWLGDFIRSESNGREIRVYAKDPDFDCVILRTAYDLAHIPCPWHYWQTRSVRTTLEDYGFSKKLRAQHHALNDALIQVQAVQEAMNPDLFASKEAVHGIA